MGWVTIGVAGMALAGAARAVGEAGRIARETLRSPAEEGRAPTAGGSDGRADSGPGGWIVLNALILAGGAVYHAVAGAGAVVKDLLHGEAH